MATSTKGMVSRTTAAKFPVLRKLLKGASQLLIVMQDNPDPDAIGSALALRKIANATAKTKCTLAHSGLIGRGENRALVRYLNVRLRDCAEVSVNQFDLVAVVDAQPDTGNITLPEGFVPHIVIDHHPTRRVSRQVQFTDIRKDYGAVATIMTEYLVAAGIVCDVHLATALLYGIRSDTQDLGRETIAADIRAIEYLYPLANKRALSAIQRGEVPREYFVMLGEALVRARIFGNALIVHLGSTSNPDMISEAADLFLRYDKADWTMCTGVFEDRLLISVRTSDMNNRADRVIKQVVAARGTGGGHRTYAGGQVPVSEETRRNREHTERLVERRFLKATGLANCPGRELI